MPKISTRVTFDKTAAIARIKAASNAGLTAMGNQALQDATTHTPEDQGTLKSSGLARSDMAAENGKFTMRWSMPYAQYLWHGDKMYGNPTNRTYGDGSPEQRITFTSALAHAEWAKYAREVYGEEWKKVYQEAMRKELKR